ncbi:MAG: tetratricopeptide repeat protein [bacterium]|nr:tetratricopeptide repeat protein [bacterium]
MVRNRSFDFYRNVLLSSMAMIFLLAGCTNAKKSHSPGVTGSLKRNSLAKNSTRAQLPVKASPLANNTTKLAKAFNKNPANSKLAINYVYHLRSLGLQQQAVNILYRAYQANPEHPVIASEYGRLLLGSGKTVQARRVLGRIEKKSSPDWHTLSALGTIEARNGSYEKATSYFQQARELAPKKASVLNNLALSIALGGKPDEAENLLRNADDSGRFGARLRQNLALVLALQGKYDEAQAMATTDLPPAQAKKNIAYLKSMLSTTTSQDGIELTDETTPPVANTMAGNLNEGPATTASVGAPVQLDPAQQ